MTGAEVNNMRSYTSTPQYIFVAWCLVEQRDNFALTLPGDQTSQDVISGPTVKLSSLEKVQSSALLIR
jgi:hypothetical protein